jgi:predicted nucleic acid-binding protein
LIVVDSSVLIAAVFEAGRRGDASREVLGRGDLTAPELIDVEAAHAARGLLRAGKISRAGADRFMLELPRLAVERVPHRALLTRMWALRDNVTAYDAAYLALAELLGATLVTGDAALSGVPGIGCAVDLIS